MKPGFKYAIKGILRCVREEGNMRIHLCAAFYVIAAGLITRLNTMSWAAVLLCIALVIGAEMINTAIENLCDAVTKEYNPLIEKAKDAAAGAVLVCAVFSAAVGLIVFLSNGRPEAALNFALTHPVIAGILLLSVIFAVIFVKNGGKGKKND